MPAPFSNVQQDFRNAARIFVRQPAFAAVVVITLALGIAANTTVFTIVNGVVLRDMPFEDADQIVELGIRGGGNGNGLSYAELDALRQATRSFEAIAAVLEDPVNVSGGDRRPERRRGAFVSANTLPLLRQAPALGRGFVEADERPGAEAVVIVGHDLWRHRYDADPRVVGRIIRVNGVPSTVIAVMPPDFGFPFRADLWLPLSALPDDVRSSRSNRSLDGVGRLRTGVSYEQALTELSGITAALAQQFPDSNRNTSPRVEQFRSGIGRPFNGLVVALLGAVAFVLLIACANTANLLLARAVERAREVAVRLALGASRWRVARELLAESLTLAAAGGLLGLGLSYLGVQVFWYFVANTDPPYWLRFTINRAVLSYLTVLCLGSAILCGLIPAWQASRGAIASILGDSGRASSESGRGRRWTGVFVIAQVALALILLTGATLAIRSLITLTRTDAGVDTSGLVQMQVSLPGRTYATADQQLLAFERLEQRLLSVNGADTAMASHAPMLGAAVGVPAFERTANGTNAVPAPEVSAVLVGERYFDVIGVRVRQGRAFIRDDMRSVGEAVIVNQRFAERHFPGASPLGQRFRLSVAELTRVARASDGRWVTVVGVVDNVRQGPLNAGEFEPLVYIPYQQQVRPTMTIIGRAGSNLALTVQVVRDQVRMLDAELPVFDVSTVEEKVSFSRWGRRIFGSMFSIFAAIALLLATFGLYSVTAYAVSRRTREIGIRLALGGSARRIWWAVLRPTLWQLGIGLGFGLSGAAAVSGALPGMLEGVSGPSQTIIGGNALLLLLVGTAACAIPCRRAIRLPPAESLRSE